MASERARRPPDPGTRCNATLPKPTIPRKLARMPHEFSIVVQGHATRILEQGTAGTHPAVVFFAGIGGVPTWLPFLDRLAADRKVFVPSMPGFPGAEHFRHLDTLVDWVLHAVECVEALGTRPVDLVGSSVGGALAAEVAAIADGLVNRMVLIAPFGLFDPDEPAEDIWAASPTPDTLPNLVCEVPDNWYAAWQRPAAVDPVDWQIIQTRAMEAAARLLAPHGDTGVAMRLHRIRHPTLLLRGDRDRMLPASYNERFRDALGGPARTATIGSAGHLAELDAPDELALQILAFLDQEFA